MTLTKYHPCSQEIPAIGKIRVVNRDPKRIKLIRENVKLMRYFSYIVARDYGFAPNPFGNFCTLATCKPEIRKAATIGDWVIGTGSAGTKTQAKLVYAMQVTEKLTFNQYWEDDRFQFKKPVMNGSIKQMYGDNIYHQDSQQQWFQSNSHHTHDDGSLNTLNLDRDTKGTYVLISTNFYYFGKKCINIPDDLITDICMTTQGFKYVNNNSGATLIQFLQDNYRPRRIGDPLKLSKTFDRYKGI